MSIFKDLTFVIPVRIGSSRIQEKVLLEFPVGSGKNLIEHKVTQIRTMFPGAQIILSCGEERLINLGKKLGIKISLRTGRHINGHDVGTRESICEVIKDVRTKHVAWTTVVTPLHDELIMKYAVDSYYQSINEGYDSLTTGVRIYEYLWQNHKPLNYSADENHPDSQFLPELTRLSNGIYISEKKIMDKCGYFLGTKPKIIHIPKICSIDIDEMDDYWVAKDAYHWYKEVRDAFFTN